MKTDAPENFLLEPSDFHLPLVAYISPEPGCDRFALLRSLRRAESYHDTCAFYAFHGHSEDERRAARHDAALLAFEIIRVKDALWESLLSDVVYAYMDEVGAEEAAQ